MGNELVKDKSVRILLDRRAEILEQINKLQAEYSAIEDLIMRDYRHKQEHKNKKGEER
jgi:hypothetical protein